MDIPSATAAIIEGGRRLGARGLISAAEGNLSVRLDAERLLVTPTGRRKDELEPDDLVLIRPGHHDAGEAAIHRVRAAASHPPPTWRSTSRSMPRAPISGPWSTPTCRHRWR